MRASERERGRASKLRVLKSVSWVSHSGRQVSRANRGFFGRVLRSAFVRRKSSATLLAPAFVRTAYTLLFSSPVLTSLTSNILSPATTPAFAALLPGIGGAPTISVFPPSGISMTPTPTRSYFCISAYWDGVKYREYLGRVLGRDCVY